MRKVYIPMLISAVVFATCFSIRYFGKNYTTPECLQSLPTNLYLWAAVLAILGCGKAWIDNKTKLTVYMTKAGFGFYILHYPMVLVACYLLSDYCKLPVIWTYTIALVTELVLTPLLFELLRRIPIIRYLVLGIKEQKSK